VKGRGSLFPLHSNGEESVVLSLSMQGTRMAHRRERGMRVVRSGGCTKCWIPLHYNKESPLDLGEEDGEGAWFAVSSPFE